MALTLPRGTQIVAATHNPGKVIELAALLDGRFEVASAGALGVSEPEETETTFVGNALLKARHSAAVTGRPASRCDRNSRPARAPSPWVEMAGIAWQ